MAVEIGALIVSLRANSAQFQAEMDGARKGLVGVGAAGHSAGAGVTHFAAKLVGDLVPGLFVTTRELSTLIRLATTATGVLGTLAQAGLVAGAGAVGYAAGNALANFRDLIHAGYGIKDAFHLAVGSTKSYDEEVKKATEEQTKFIETLTKTRDALLASQTALAAAQGKGNVLAATARGDLPGASTAELQASLEAIRLASEARRNEIDKMRTDQDTRRKLEQENLQTMATLRQNAYLQDAINQQKIAQEEAATQFKIWKDQTDLLMGEFQKRLKLRQDFESSLGQGGVGGGVATGLGAATTLAKQVEKETRDIAGARRLGMLADKQYFDAVTDLQRRAYDQAQSLYDTWADFPSVERAISVAVDRMRSGFGPLGDAMQDAATWAQRNVDTNQELAGTWQAALDQFSKVPQATGQAGVAVQKLANDYNDLAWQAAGATQQIYAAAAAMVYFHSVGG